MSPDLCAKLSRRALGIPAAFARTGVFPTNFRERCVATSSLQKVEINVSSLPQAYPGLCFGTPDGAETWEAAKGEQQFCSALINSLILCSCPSL